VHAGKGIPASLNIGTRRTESTSEFHNNKFAYIGAVAFDHYLGENDHSIFPAIKTPAQGTKILKWYKSNKDAVTGVTEPLLVAEVDKLCKKYDGLKLLNHIAIPIQNREYSYRPDIALYWENYNLCIELPDTNWSIVEGETENLKEIYDEIYKFGALKYEIETFSESGKCQIKYYR
jgi:hypothetical protein